MPWRHMQRSRRTACRPRCRRSPSFPSRWTRNCSERSVSDGERRFSSVRSICCARWGRWSPLRCSGRLSTRNSYRPPRPSRMRTEDMLAGWARALDRRERIEDGHSERVTDLALRLARTLGRGPGPVATPAPWRPAPRHRQDCRPRSDPAQAGTARRRRASRHARHTGYAYDLLGPIDFLRPALEIPYFHHERWDGTGIRAG